MYAARHPYPAINACAIGGSSIAPVPTPAINSASAKPRRLSNQVETAREYPIWVVPFPTIPSTTKMAYRCAKCGVRKPSDANATPKTAIQGRITRRGPNLSSRWPSGGEHTATVSAANPKAAEIDSRLHPNAPLKGFRKMLNVKTSNDPKLTIAPQ